MPADRVDRRSWSRRRFLGAAGVAAAASVSHSGAAVPVSEVVAGRSGGRRRGTFALDAQRLRFHSPAVTQSFSVLFVADTHLFRDDARGEPFRTYSGRMAKAYNQTKHFQTGAATDPEAGLRSALQAGKDARVAWVMLAGDIVSFPSEAGVEFVLAQMAEAGLPFGYVAGNHDWHYEGMPGSSAELRQAWIDQRLRPLYGGRDPLMWVHEVNGVRMVALDNSTYEITPEQLAFFRRQVRSRQPLVLFVHIPLYAPGRSVGFGCGHPEWGAKTDRGFEVERRPRWPESGHTRTTLAFHREVFAAENLLGICAGHIHRPSLDVVKGIPQVVAEANATGAYLLLEFLPEPEGRRMAAAALEV